MKINLRHTLIGDRLLLDWSVCATPGLDDEKYKIARIYRNPRFVADILLKWTIAERWDARLVVNNLFEEQTPRFGWSAASPWYGYQGESERFVYAGVTYRFPGQGK